MPSPWGQGLPGTWLWGRLYEVPPEAGRMKPYFKNRCIRIWLGNEKGVSAVEFALVAPLFFIFFIGIIEYGWFMTSQMLLSHAVSQGARAAVRLPEDSEDDAFREEARDRVKTVFRLAGKLSDSDISVDIEDASTHLGHPLPRKVTVSVENRTYTPLAGFLPAGYLPRALDSRSTCAFP